MHLTGSCHCQKVRFSLNSETPVPFLRCYCSICRKTAGTGGFSINIGGDFNSLEVEGKEHISVYQAWVRNEENGEITESPMQRSFCGHCGTALWCWDPRWPDLVHPHASAIDTPLPTPPANTHIMLASKAPWVDVKPVGNDKCFDTYPDESLADWHRRMAELGEIR